MSLLTEDERARFREIEVLKDSIRRELRAGSKVSGVSGFFKHPTVLLLLGFLSTGVVGTWLANNWKAREWENQQRYLGKQRALEKKYAVIDETFKAVAETNTAAEDILAQYSWDLNPKEVEQRRTNWFATSRSWRISSKIVRQKLGTYFTNPAVQSQFDKIIDERRQAGNVITNLLMGSKKSEKETQEMRDDALNSVNRTGAQLKECGRLMALELVQR